MIVEHVFVTTVEPGEAMRRASLFLVQRGFVATQDQAFALDQTGWTILEVRRGKTLKRARSVLDLPQQIRIEWDRGRMTVAASIGNRMSKRQRTTLLFAIANGLELLLARQMPDEAAGMEWARLEAVLRRRARTQLIWKWAVAILFFGICVWWILLGVRTR